MPSINYIVKNILREADVLLRGLLDNGLVGIYVVQGDRFVFVNQRFADLFGYSQEELCNGYGPIDLTASPYRLGIQSEIDSRLRGESMQNFYGFKGICRDGKELDAEVFGVTTEFEGFPAIIGILLDVSIRTSAQRDYLNNRPFPRRLS